MRPHALLCLLLASPLLSPVARGAEVNGYVESRTQYTRSRVDGVLPTRGQPELQQLFEFNGQLRHEYRPGGVVSADLSLFLSMAGRYRSLNAEQREVGVRPTEEAGAQPIASINELFLQHEFAPAFNVLAGKKRLIWGAGLAYNPTDLLNPLKDPTDPTFQRAGAWMVRLEVPLEKYAFTLLASPAVTEQVSGLPRSILTYPSWDKRDDELHYLIAARAYALVLDADVNLMLFHSNLYRNAFEDKTQLGFSFSRYFFTDYELHVEALVGAGSPRLYAAPDCVASPEAALGCAERGADFLVPRRIKEGRIRPQILAGTRYMFSDESMVSLEYLYQADGLKKAEAQDYLNGLSLLRSGEQFGLDPSGIGFGGADPGLPQKFSFEPITRHYAFLSFQKPKIRDDFTFSVVLVSSLQDLSGLVSPSLAWSAKEWLTLTLSAFVPYAGPRSLAAKRPGTGEAVSEFSLLPLKYRGLFQARIFY
ncbi:hypothetical protein [Stigmatella hybrida]|uniref:hypothetical protein n=1 Tax=Stigmatella hybrida TaxID=394097 RepID=UPI001CDACB39|nr:hypothetical protein [Stigmatella hybrida]